MSYDNWHIHVIIHNIIKQYCSVHSALTVQNTTPTCTLHLWSVKKSRIIKTNKTFDY